MKFCPLTVRNRVRAADPAAAVHAALRSDPLARPVDGRHFLVAIGKAACPMTNAALTYISRGALATAIAVTKCENVRDVGGCTVYGAGHPIPDENRLRAGRILEPLACRRSRAVPANWSK